MLNTDLQQGMRVINDNDLSLIIYLSNNQIFIDGILIKKPLKLNDFEKNEILRFEKENIDIPKNVIKKISKNYNAIKLFFDKISNKYNNKKPVIWVIDCNKYTFINENNVILKDIKRITILSILSILTS